MSEIDGGGEAGDATDVTNAADAASASQSKAPEAKALKSAMKNAIVISVANARWAIELRWVREVITLGHTTPVPHAPPAFAGVVNFGGAIVPVLELMPLVEPAAGFSEASVPGASAVLLQVESVRAALRVDTVVEVTTLRHLGSDRWTDAAGLDARLVDPQELVARARAQVSNAPVMRDRREPT